MLICSISLHIGVLCTYKKKDALLDGADHVDAHEALARDVVGCHFFVEGECGAVPSAQCGDNEGDEDRVLIFID
jgi:hypothetical protein